MGHTFPLLNRLAGHKMIWGFFFAVLLPGRDTVLKYRAPKASYQKNKTFLLENVTENSLKHHLCCRKYV
ncbi:hypothetical protein B4Q04_19340 [Zobellia sp. OII3]|nr:hypothetical protein B4Q04_19340 [Zobellia sp. OII3]